MSLGCSIKGQEEGKEVGASPLRHKIDFLAFCTVELLWTQYSHAITQGFSLWQYPQLSVLHILLPKQCNQLIASLEPHKPKLSPSPYGLGELFWWLQALEMLICPQSAGAQAKLPHQGSPIWALCSQTLRSLLSAQDPPGGRTKAIHPSKVLRSGILHWGKGREKITDCNCV